CVLGGSEGVHWDLDPGGPPRRDPAGGVPEPGTTDANAAHESDGAVDLQRLAMIAREPSERTIEPRRVVAAHLHPARAQSPPESARGLCPAAQPIVEQPDLDSAARPLDQRSGELAAGLVVVDEVVLDVNVVPRRPDRGLPRRIDLLRIPEEPDVIAGDERSAGGPGEGLVGEGAS